MVDQELYSELILDLYKNPINYGKLEKPDLHASGGNPLCGDQVTIELQLNDDKIKDIKFSGNGCAISMASASLLTELVKGKSLDEVMKLENKDIFAELGQIVETRLKCALVSLKVLQDGVQFYQKNPKKNRIILNIKI